MKPWKAVLGVALLILPGGFVVGGALLLIERYTKGNGSLLWFRRLVRGLRSDPGAKDKEPLH